MSLKPGQTGRVYPHISECGLQRALEFLSKELTMQGVKELYADSLDSFLRTENTDTCASVLFYDDNKRFKASEIEDVFYYPERNSRLYIEGLCDSNTTHLRNQDCCPHKHCVWKEGVWSFMTASENISKDTTAKNGVMSEPGVTKHETVYVYTKPYIVEYDKWRNEHVGHDFVCDETKTADGVCCVLGYAETKHMFNLAEHFRHNKNAQLYGGLSHREEGGCSVFCG